MIPTVTEQTANGLLEATTVSEQIDTLMTTTSPAPQPLTLQERAQAFSQEFTMLCRKYGVEMRPFIKSYNDGQQAADVDFVAVGK